MQMPKINISTLGLLAWAYTTLTHTSCQTFGGSTQVVVNNGGVRLPVGAPGRMGGRIPIHAPRHRETILCEDTILRPEPGKPEATNLFMDVWWNTLEQPLDIHDKSWFGVIKLKLPDFEWMVWFKQMFHCRVNTLRLEVEDPHPSTPLDWSKHEFVSEQAGQPVGFKATTKKIITGQHNVHILQNLLIFFWDLMIWEHSTRAGVLGVIFVVVDLGLTRFAAGCGTSYRGGQGVFIWQATVQARAGYVVMSGPTQPPRIAAYRLVIYECKFQVTNWTHSYSVLFGHFMVHNLKKWSPRKITIFQVDLIGKGILPAKTIQVCEFPQSRWHLPFI